MGGVGVIVGTGTIVPGGVVTGVTVLVTRAVPVPTAVPVAPGVPDTTVPVGAGTGGVGVLPGSPGQKPKLR